MILLVPFLGQVVEPVEQLMEDLSAGLRGIEPAFSEIGPFRDLDRFIPGFLPGVGRRNDRGDTIHDHGREIAEAGLGLLDRSVQFLNDFGVLRPGHSHLSPAVQNILQPLRTLLRVHNERILRKILLGKSRIDPTELSFRLTDRTRGRRDIVEFYGHHEAATLADGERLASKPIPVDQSLHDMAMIRLVRGRRGAPIVHDFRFLRHVSVPPIPQGGSATWAPWVPRVYSSRSDPDSEHSWGHQGSYLHIGWPIGTKPARSAQTGTASAVLREPEAQWASVSSAALHFSFSY